MTIDACSPTPSDSSSHRTRTRSPSRSTTYAAAEDAARRGRPVRARQHRQRVCHMAYFRENPTARADASTHRYAPNRGTLAHLLRRSLRGSPAIARAAAPSSTSAPPRRRASRASRAPCLHGGRLEGLPGRRGNQACSRRRRWPATAHRAAARPLRRGPRCIAGAAHRATSGLLAAGEPRAEPGRPRREERAAREAGARQCRSGSASHHRRPKPPATGVDLQRRDATQDAREGRRVLRRSRLASSAPSAGATCPPASSRTRTVTIAIMQSDAFGIEFYAPFAPDRVPGRRRRGRARRAREQA